MVKDEWPGGAPRHMLNVDVQMRQRPRGRRRLGLAVLTAIAVCCVALAVGVTVLKNRTPPATHQQRASLNVLTDEIREHIALARYEMSLSGWVDLEDGSRCYYDPDTHKRRTGWLDIDDQKFYFDADTGEMHVGWLSLDGKRYWLSTGHDGEILGSLAADRWLALEGEKYHLAANGVADTGWHEIEGLMYCFDEQGAMQTGWAEGQDGKQRWLNPETGVMATNEWVEIDGLWQPFDDGGSWVSYGETIPPNNERDMSALTVRQLAVIEACDLAPWPGKGLCAGWVTSVFAVAGEPSVGGNACDMARAWCVSDDLAQLKPGMLIAVPTHSRTENGKIWGHVCVYVGDGIVRDSGTYGIRRIQLGSWLAWFGVDESPKWGWSNGIDLSAQEG